jgi:phytanoyl-CoA hydroxylase
MDIESTLPRFSAPAGGKLSEAMISAFDESGVILLENFVSAQACDRLRARALALVDAFDPTGLRSTFSTTCKAQHRDRYYMESGDKIRFFLEADAFGEDGRLRQSKEDSLNKMGHAMHDLDPVFEAFSYTPALAEITRRLGVRDPGVLQSMYIFKPPRIGGEVVFHQDSTYLYTEPESCIGFWFALEDATTGNGCMHFIPGGHKGPLRERSFRSADDRLIVETLDHTPWEEDRAIAAEAGAGSLVIFHGRAPHCSGPNRSARSRHAYTLHVIDQACQYPADNWLQRGEDMPLRGFC